MYKMYKKTDLNWYTDSFDSCDLATLNERAAMLTRIDNKYIVKAQDLMELKLMLAEKFDILEINGNRGFNYDTTYFDDSKKSAFFENLQGKRKRFKVRIRKYVDAGICFAELKVKELRGTTVKKRYDHEYDYNQVFDGDVLQQVKNGYQSHYNTPFKYAIEPVLDIDYQRLTLVSKDGSERMTIDTDIVFSNGQDRLEIADGYFIVEAKSTNGRGYADRCLRSKHHYPFNNCSKYCIGMASLSKISRFNYFLPTMRKLQIFNTPHIETAQEMPLAA